MPERKVSPKPKSGAKKQPAKKASAKQVKTAGRETKIIRPWGR